MHSEPIPFGPQSGDDSGLSLEDLLAADQKRQQRDEYFAKQTARFDQLLTDHDVPTVARFDEDVSVLRQRLYDTTSAGIEEMMHEDGIYDEEIIETTAIEIVVSMLNKDITFLTKMQMTSTINDLDMRNPNFDRDKVQQRKAKIIAEAMYKYRVDFDSSWVSFLNEAVAGDMVTQDDVQVAMLKVIEEEANAASRAAQIGKSWQVILQDHDLSEIDQDEARRHTLLLDLLPVMHIRNVGEHEQQISLLAAKYGIDPDTMRKVADSFREFMNNE